MQTASTTLNVSSLQVVPNEGLRISWKDKGLKTTEGLKMYVSCMKWK